MHELKVTLKQHTPLIHFQHDQEGATLRASEVKPKLDRFILTMLGKNTTDQELISKSQYKTLNNYEKGRFIAKDLDWITKGQEGALNYKMRINFTDKNEKTTEYMIVSYMNGENINNLKNNGINVLSNTPYFAQEDKSRSIIQDTRKWDDIDKKGLLCNKEIILNIMTWDEELIKYISTLIQTFFLINNFGTRQSKGFGGFEVIHCLFDGNEIKMQNKEMLLCENFSFVYKKSINNPDLQIIFKQINDDYKLLKSGQTRPYAKSRLMLFGLKNHIRWDKRFLKKNINDKYETKIENKYEVYYLKGRTSDKTVQYGENDKYMYLRALLGLAEQYEFLLDNPAVTTGKNKMIVKVANSADIQRFSSPLLFKVINNTIYLAGNDIPQDILGKDFSFLVTIQGDENHINKEINRTLPTPNNFSLEKFMHFAMNNNNPSLNYRSIKNNGQ